MPDWHAKKSWLIALGLLSLALVLIAGLVSGAETGVLYGWLHYERDAVLSGELWRLLTAHWLHLDGMHLLLNTLALAVIVYIALPVMTVGIITISFLLCSLAVTTGLLVFNPDIGWYVGLSGVLHGLLVLASCRYLQRGDIVGGLLLFIVFKLVLEQLGVSLTGSALLPGGVVVDAHLYGAVSGLLLFFLLRPYGRRSIGVSPAGLSDSGATQS